jgi:outer membrane biosynthesis protein TonB
MTRINAERTNRYLPALISNGKLSAAANVKSSDMISRSYFAHVDPDGNYVWPVIEAQGYKPYQSLGENLAIDFSTAQAVVSAWMNSPGHRNNILNEKFQDQGMAAVYGEYEDGHNTYLITNLFGTLLKVAGDNTPTPSPVPPPPAPNPVPVPAPAPAVSPTPSPTPTPQPQPAPSPDIEPTPSPAPTQPDATETPTEPEPTTDLSTLPGMTGQEPSAISTSDRAGLGYLKIVLAMFAGIYTFFLIIDSIIIHRAQVRRENIPSSPHSLLLLLVAAINFLTIWL